jgi:hypothetical protein
MGVHLLLRQPVSIPKVAKWFRKFRQLLQPRSPAYRRFWAAGRTAKADYCFGTGGCSFRHRSSTSRLCVPTALFYYFNGQAERSIGLAWGMAPVIIAAWGI